jgi:hypothetical protein
MTDDEIEAQRLLDEAETQRVLKAAREAAGAHTRAPSAAPVSATAEAIRQRTVKIGDLDSILEPIGEVLKELSARIRDLESRGIEPMPFVPRAEDSTARDPEVLAGHLAAARVRGIADCEASGIDPDAPAIQADVFQLGCYVWDHSTILDLHSRQVALLWAMATQGAAKKAKARARKTVKRMVEK